MYGKTARRNSQQPPPFSERMHTRAHKLSTCIWSTRRVEMAFMCNVLYDIQPVWYMFSSSVLRVSSRAPVNNLRDKETFSEVQ